MKTAMELALARIEMNQDINPDSIHWEMFKNDCMEKEKNQIIHAMEIAAMYVSAASLDKEIGKMTFEDLYNKTYKTYNQKYDGIKLKTFIRDEFDFQMPEKEIEARNIIQDLKDRHEKD
jgi:hypothetical protein